MQRVTLEVFMYLASCSTLEKFCKKIFFFAVTKLQTLYYYENLVLSGSIYSFVQGVLAYNLLNNLESHTLIHAHQTS